MEEFRASEILCDVVLESSDGALFKVHKLVLASCSSYFQAMFTNEMRESREDKIKMALESPVLKVLIEFAYTCKMELKSLADVKAVLVAANMLLFSGAETICADFISKKINTRNCVDIITFAEVVSSEQLSRTAFEFMEKNFVEICSHKGFLSLPASLMKKLVSSENLNIRCSEEGVLKFVLAWLNHDQSNRLEHCLDVMKNVRLPLIPRNLLIKFLGSEFEELKKTGCDALVDEINSYQLHPEKRAIIHTPRTQPRHRTPKKLCVVGGLSGFDSPDRYLNRTDYFKLENEEKWQEMAPLCTARESAAVVKLNGLIFVMGGVSFSANLSSVECFNPQLDSWTEMPPLKYCKGQVAGTVLNGCIYVIGGSDDHLREGLKTVEKYNPLTNEWEVVTPMRMGRGALGVATLEGKIYACGGANFNFAFSSVEVYDQQKNRWQSASPMKRARAFHDVVVAHGFLYALGGAEMHNGQLANIQASAERFCPRANQWTVIKSLYMPCWGVRAVVNEKSWDQEVDIYIVGSFNADSGYGAVAKLSIGDDDSHMLTRMPYFDDPSPRIQAGVVILP
ncbi:hypothetical protein ACROYT_G038449 [Oculina patagonica]